MCRILRLTTALFVMIWIPSLPNLMWGTWNYLLISPKEIFLVKSVSTKKNQALTSSEFNKFNSINRSIRSKHNVKGIIFHKNYVSSHKQSQYIISPDHKTYHLSSMYYLFLLNENSLVKLVQQVKKCLSPVRLLLAIAYYINLLN